MILRNEEETREFWEAFPYPYRLTYGADFVDDAIQVSINVHNLGQNEMPIAPGLHPYHPVPAKRKNEIRFCFPGGKLIEDAVRSWGNGGTIEVDNPISTGDTDHLILKIPKLGDLWIYASQAFRKIWVWSEPDSGFFCLEFVTRPEGGIVDDPIIVPPNSKLSDVVPGPLEVRYKLLD